MRTVTTEIRTRFAHGFSSLWVNYCLIELGWRSSTAGGFSQEVTLYFYVLGGSHDVWAVLREEGTVGAEAWETNASVRSIVTLVELVILLLVSNVLATIATLVTEELSTGVIDHHTLGNSTIVPGLKGPRIPKFIHLALLC